MCEARAEHKFNFGNVTYGLYVAWCKNQSEGLYIYFGMHAMKFKQHLHAHTCVEKISKL
jgi:hypothetical protein